MRKPAFNKCSHLSLDQPVHLLSLTKAFTVSIRTLQTLRYHRAGIDSSFKLDQIYRLVYTVTGQKIPKTGFLRIWPILALQSLKHTILSDKSQDLVLSNKDDLIPTFFSSSINSPLLCMSNIMSQPPTNSPPMKT